MTGTDKVVAFHIGAHKTGTSVLQRYLNAHAEELARQGLLVLGRRELGDCIGWGRPLVHRPERRTERLATFGNDPHHQILFGSNENTMGRPFTARGRGRLYPSARRNIAALERVTRGEQTRRIFLSVRPQADFLESYYLQSVHEGGTATFDEWLTAVDLRRLSWRPLVTALQDCFGPDQVEIIDFRSIDNGQGEYVRQFLGALHPRFDRAVVMTESVNRSISEKGLRLALAINPLLPDRTDRGAFRRFLQHHFSNVDYPRPVLLSDAQRRILLRRYGDEYDALVATASPPSAALRTRPSTDGAQASRPPVRPVAARAPGHSDPALARRLFDALNEHLDTAAERAIVEQFVSDRFGARRRRGVAAWLGTVRHRVGRRTG